MASKADKVLFLPVAAALLFVAYYFRDWRPERFRQTTAPIVTLGHQGQWVTRPDGRKVCRLRYDLTIHNAISTGFCEDWQEPEPKFGQPVEGWIRANPEAAGYQIMIEGSWRP